MHAILLVRDRLVLEPGLFAEIVVWRVPSPVPASAHDLKYRIALIHGRRCVIRYDNEAGKGDHRHVGDTETPYAFTTVDDLLRDFWYDVGQWRVT